MAKYVAMVNGYRVYELDKTECVDNGRVYPTFVCWYKNDNENIGDMTLTENETETIQEMCKWCKEH